MQRMRRIEHGVSRPERCAIVVDGHPVEAFRGESLATAMLAAGMSTFRRTRSGDARGPFCNMGVCFDCVVQVDGVSTRACMTPVSASMTVETGG